MNSAMSFLPGRAVAPLPGSFRVRWSSRALICQRIRTRCLSPQAGRWLEFHFRS